ncbi:MULTISPECIES: SDR family NAD(P)-dependent oxidoreductase [unclassified Rhodococcus (in: high G+C Gram-positive bacteria)]|uniref:SDR family NAD(P)-dependent oxidoreductase n=1 Tax=unclassified Rhodococcus (in: high G+C Gram-positive bacteria) TaxID=192944 RepID=UPI00146D2629|nr:MULTISPECIES: SDR family oxidoreductase [unclassified Rhodococcus (in: high G+C Gram-positive bacteria)]MBF0661100.1 SDR family oxidoreductase [Rhodococcus sp. (in: high G+C Gram-positive bacteria)]NME80779.1 SDR family oxidoreductase [Rhodococcus sp. 105337]
MRLTDKVAVVTGGAGGIGRGIVRAFTKEGARVLFVDIDDDAGRALEEELGGAGKFMKADISVEENAAAIVAAAVDAFGQLDILVNNAHASRQAPLLETTQEMLDLSFGTGFYPTFWLMKAAHPQLAAQRGSVINFASGAGIDGLVTQGSYAAAKEAIRAISRVAANEWAGDDINVNIISPLALTEGVEAYIQANPGIEKALLAKTPLGRFGDPEADIGGVAVFLASRDAAYMTGQTLMVDGGTIKLR